MFDKEVFVGGLSTAVFSLGLLIVLFILRRLQQPRETKNPLLNTFLTKLRKAPIAHRGGTPENTLVAIRNSKANGASGIEVDLAFTKDGHPVILHDDTVDRTSNGKGNISDKTLEEARKLDFGIVFGCVYSAGLTFIHACGTTNPLTLPNVVNVPERYSTKRADPAIPRALLKGVFFLLLFLIQCRHEYEGERIPTLQEAVELCKELDLLMFLELKSDRKEVRAVVALLPALTSNHHVHRH